MAQTALLQHPCWGKRYLYTAAQLAEMDADFTVRVAEEKAARIVRDDAALVALREMFTDGSFHHATYRYDLSPGWHIYRKDDKGFRGFTYALGFSKDSHVTKAVEALIRGTGYSLGSYGEG